MAGEITEVGPGVTGWKAGDRVLVNPLNKKKGLMGEMLDGGMAEYCLVAADQLVAMPAGVGFEDAASLAGRLRHGAPHADHPRHRQEGRARRHSRRLRRRRHRLHHSRQASRRRGDRLHLEPGEDAEAQGARRRRGDQRQGDRFLQVGGREIRQAATAQLRRRRRRGDQLHRRRHLAPVAALPQARRQAPGLRRHRRLRPEGGSALHLELRAQDHRLQQLLRRQSAGADGAHRSRAR